MAYFPQSMFCIVADSAKGLASLSIQYATFKFSLVRFAVTASLADMPRHTMIQSTRLFIQILRRLSGDAHSTWRKKLYTQRASTGPNQNTGPTESVGQWEVFIYSEWIWWVQVMDLLDLLDLIVNCMKTCLFAKSGPNRSSRPLNMQLLFETSIRIQWNTSRGPKSLGHHIIYNEFNWFWTSCL